MEKIKYTTNKFQSNITIYLPNAVQIYNNTDLMFEAIYFRLSLSLEPVADMSEMKNLYC